MCLESILSKGILQGLVHTNHASRCLEMFKQHGFVTSVLPLIILDNLHRAVSYVLGGTDYSAALFTLL